MNKTKYVLTGFAVFASILMLTTTCIAGPVQEKTSMDAVESAREELMKSFEALFLKMEKDPYFNSLKDKISKDRTLNSIASAIEKTDDFDAKASLASSYLDALKNNKEFACLSAYFERSYSKDMQGINAQFNTFSDVSNAYYQSINTEETEEDVLMIVGVHNLNFGSQNDEDTSDTSSETGNKGTVYTCNGGTVQAIQVAITGNGGEAAPDITVPGWLILTILILAVIGAITAIYFIVMIGIQIVVGIMVLFGVLISLFLQWLQDHGIIPPGQ